MQSPDHYRRPHTGGGSPSQTISHPLSNCTSPELEPSPRSTYSQSPSNSIHADSRRSSQRITNGAHILEQPSKGAEFHEYDPLHKVLPQRAPDEDAQSAVLKLDKMRRQKEKRRKWRTRTGIVGMMGDATARKKDADDTSSDESLDLSRAFEGIKVRITNLPNHPVLDSVKRHAARAKERVGRSDTMLASPNGSLSAVDTTGATGGDDSTITRNVLSAGSGSGRNGIIRKPRARRQSIDLTEPSREPGTKEKEPTSGRDSDRDQQRARAMTPKPVSLLVVDEEGHEAEADYGPGASEGKARGRTLPDASDVGVDGTSRGASDLPSPASSPGISPTPSPSTLRALDSAMCLAPDANISRGSFSLMGGALHDEPEDHHHQPEIAYPQDSLYASRPQSREGFTRRPTSSSSSDLQNDGDSPPEEEGSDDEEGGAGGGPTSLNLEHGEPLTKKDLRRQLHRHKAIPPEAYPDSATYRAASIAHHVSRGLHYASSQSRNRRAMERYSPNPNRVLSPPQRHLSSGDLPAFTPLQMTATTSSNGGRMTPVPRSTTPGLPRDSIASSRRSSISDMDREAGGLNGTFSAVGSPTADDHDHWAIGALNLRRWGTGHASIASSRTGGAGRHYLHAPHVWQRRKRKQWGAVQVDDSPISTPKAADPEQELDKALGKLAAEQAPEEVGERYEFDVLYENQRGLLVFGIPKYSSRILLQWDPSAWTSSGMGDSPYNILNAQLPDPSWEWVHPEWLIDMSGDTDEAGWQYSGSFGHKFWPRVRWPGKPLPARGAEGAREINARTAKEQGEGEQARKKENEANNPDDEIEALQRNARAMRQKWRGRPDAWTFVRRRRWVRLRRRKALVPNVAAVDTEKDKAAEAGTLRASALGAEKDPQMKASELESSSSDSDDSAAVSDLEEDEVDSDNEAGSDYAPANARSSAWLPRRLPGDQSNGPNPAQARQGTELVERRRRHAREFTGTVRELKSLLPAILAPEWDRRARGAAAAAAAARSKAHLFTEEIDARNPFISWKLVKRRLEDDDLAFASATLRARERRHKQRTASHAHSASRRRVPSAWVEGGLGTPPNRDGSSFNAGCPPKFGGAGTSSGPGTRAEVGYDLTRDALVEINFRRVVRVLRSCRLDRQKLGLWRMWLAAPSSSSTTMPVAAEPARLEDLRDLGLAGQAGDDPVVAAAKRMKAERAMARWRIKTGAPDALDVWDVLERRLDHVLLLFEFQGSRACLLRLLLTIHATTHPEHRFREMENHQGGPPINAPEELSPFHRHGGPSEMGPGYSPDVRESEGYRACELPRLQFFSDIWDVARGLVGEARGAEVQKEREREQDKAKDRERERDWTAVSPVFSAASDDDSILPRIVGLDSLCDQWLPPAALNDDPPSRPCSADPASEQRSNGLLRALQMQTSRSAEGTIQRDQFKTTTIGSSGFGPSPIPSPAPSPARGMTPSPSPGLGPGPGPGSGSGSGSMSVGSSRGALAAGSGLLSPPSTSLSPSAAASASASASMSTIKRDTTKPDKETLPEQVDAGVKREKAKEAEIEEDERARTRAKADGEADEKFLTELFKMPHDESRRRGLLELRK